MKWNSYEISLWTHQEVYLATLCNSQNFQKYDANSPILNCSTTGQTSLTFSIPIVCYNLQTGELEDNTLWYNKLKNEKSLANEKRVKLIFDKQQGTMRIMEFVITTMEQSRNGEELYCNVTCTGLAFKWLGKIGFTLTLDSDTMLLEQEENNTELTPTINYWLDKVFPKNDDGTWATFWQYEIRMNYVGNVGKRESTKVYEDDDVVGWTDNEDGTATAVYNTQPIEKQRFISVQESNKYNISQDIAEEFEVYARYEFLYQDQTNPYKATAGKVIFYNELTQDTEYVISYGNNETGLTKTSESSDIVTKMYVDPVEDEYSDDGYVSLSQADANKMGQEYLFNFDYYITSGQMTSAQEAAVTVYENNIRKVNLQLQKIIVKRNDLQTTITDDEAICQNAYDAAVAAQDLVNDYNSKVSLIQGQLTSDVTNATETITVSKQTNGNYYEYNFTRPGIFTIDSYKTTSDSAIDSSITITLLKDQFGFITGVQVNKDSGLPVLLKITYHYNLLGYYNKAIDYYTAKAKTSMATYDSYTTLIGDKTSKQEDQSGDEYEQLNYWKNQYTAKTKQKQQLVNNFQSLMGYFIKQGKWDASDFSASYENTFASGPSEWNYGYKATGFYDTIKDSETHSYYEVGTNKTRVYYDFIQLPDSALSSIIDYSQFTIIEEYTQTVGSVSNSYSNNYINGAHGSIQFLKLTNPDNEEDYQIIPIFLFEYSDRQIHSDNSTLALYYRCSASSQKVNIDLSNFHHIQSDGYSSDKKSINETITLESGVKVSAAGTIVYRRIFLYDDNISDSTINVVNKDGTQLEQYQDYLYYKVNGIKCVTFKISNHVHAILDNTVLPLKVTYKISHSSQQLYYDAKDVLKTSAFPEVTYEVEFAYLRQSIKYRNNSSTNNDNIDLDLGCIVRINDWSLGLRNVKGIVSEFSIDIDSPQNTKFTISNYKTRFQDLFGRIVAETQSLQANSASYQRAASAITPTGEISASILQTTINNNSLIFSSGYNTNVTWDEDGIIAENTLAYANGVTGQVAIKGGGILLSNSVDDNLNRVYTTAITANGINASAMTIGRIDTEKINIYSGDNVKFMWNAEGLFAYGSDTVDSTTGTINNYICYNEQGLKFYQDSKQIVSLDWKGLYIGAQKGAVELTGQQGLSMYDKARYDSDGNQVTDRVRLLHAGKYTDQDNNTYYGFRLFNTSNQPTLITDNTGSIWLKEKIQIGNDISAAGITAEGDTKYTEATDSQTNITTKSISTAFVRFWAGSEYDSRDSAPFRVLDNGSLYATNATISGSITATSGSIGGWTISNYGISSNGINLIAAHEETVQGETSSIPASISVTGTDGNSVTIGQNGQLTATGVNISGTINASGGTIGNVSIASIVGDTKNINFKITSNNGNITKYNESFTTTLTLTGYKGFVQFDSTDYDNYTYQWQSKTDSSDWSDIDAAISITYQINDSFTSKTYYQCVVTEKSTGGAS